MQQSRDMSVIPHKVKNHLYVRDFTTSPLLYEEPCTCRKGFLYCFCFCKRTISALIIVQFVGVIDIDSFLVMQYLLPICIIIHKHTNAYFVTAKISSLIVRLVSPEDGAYQMK